MAQTLAPGLRSHLEPRTLEHQRPRRAEPRSGAQTATAARPVERQPIESRPHLTPVADREVVGRRLVGVTALFGALTLLVLFGLAFFHNVLARGQYELSQLDTEVRDQRELLLDLRFELERLTAPSEVGRLAEDRQGLVPSVAPVDVVIAAEVVRAVSSTDEDVLDESTHDWPTLKPLLADQ